MTSRSFVENVAHSRLPGTFLIVRVNKMWSYHTQKKLKIKNKIKRLPSPASVKLTSYRRRPDCGGVVSQRPQGIAGPVSVTTSLPGEKVEKAHFDGGAVAVGRQAMSYSENIRSEDK